MKKVLIDTSVIGNSQKHICKIIESTRKVQWGEFSIVYNHNSLERFENPSYACIAELIELITLGRLEAYVSNETFLGKCHV